MTDCNDVVRFIQESGAYEMSRCFLHCELFFIIPTLIALSIVHCFLHLSIKRFPPMFHKPLNGI